MPNRVLRDWTDSERIELLSPGAEVFFVRLMMKADDYGCYHGHLKLLKATLYPFREVKLPQITEWIDECLKVKIISLYIAEDKPYIFIYNFGQRMRTMVRKFPAPESGNETDVSHLTVICQQPAVKSPPERKPKGNRKETEVEGEIPTVEVFLKYCKEYLEKEKKEYAPYEFALKAKYNQWKEANWIDGNEKAILNWKTKIQNTIPYLKKDFGGNGTAHTSSVKQTEVKSKPDV